MDTPEEMPPAVLEMVRRQRREQMIDQALEPLREAGSEKIESEILCDLWRDLGDHTESYWQAMCAASAFARIDRFIFSEMDKLSQGPRLRVMEAVAATLQEKLRLQREIAAKRQELMAANPLPGDHS